MIPGLLALATLAASIPALAQDADSPPARSKNRTLRYADDGKKPAAGVEVVEPSRSSVLKEWEVGQSGQPAMTYIVPSVVGITLIGGGRENAAKARWTFALTNTGDRATYFILNVAECYIVDEQVESYRPISYQYSPDRNGYWQADLRPDAKTKFAMDFEVPRTPSKTWKIGMVLKAQRGLHATDAIKLFTIKLKKPLFYDDGVFELAEEKEKDPEAPGLRGGEMDGGSKPTPGAAKGSTIRLTPPGTGSTPQTPDETAHAFMALSLKGLTVNGSIMPKSGGNMPGRIVFRRKPISDLVEAHIVSMARGSTMNIEVFGAYLEDLSTPSGVSLKMIDVAKTKYTFSLSGNNLTGADELGNRFAFVIPTK